MPSRCFVNQIRFRSMAGEQHVSRVKPNCVEDILNFLVNIETLFPILCTLGYYDILFL